MGLSIRSVPLPTGQPASLTPGSWLNSSHKEIRAKQGAMSFVTGNSAHVKITLILDDWDLPAVQLGPNFLLLKAPVGAKAVHGRLLLEVDGVQRAWNIELPDGLPIKSPRVRLRAKPD